MFVNHFLIQLGLFLIKGRKKKPVMTTGLGLWVFCVLERRTVIDVNDASDDCCLLKRRLVDDLRLVTRVVRKHQYRAIQIALETLDEQLTISH